jgi:5-carboxymethyl-2-hydroxymuconate isomerase
VPHIVIEYSANLESEIDPMTLVRAVHEAALAQPVFETIGVRTRAARREHFLIADGDPTHTFVAVTARIGPGRTLEARKSAGEAMMAAIYAKLEQTYNNRGLLLSVEVTQLDGPAMTRRNSLRETTKVATHV